MDRTTQAAWSEDPSLARPQYEDGCVLIVDDDPDMRRALGDIATHTGYDVAFGEDGEMALGLLRDGLRPSFIVLDLMMPKMDGAEFLSIVQATDELKAIPIVIFS